MPSSRPRDSQRSKLYAAERAAFEADRQPDVFTFPECGEYYRLVLGQPWFERRWPHVGHIQVKDGRGTRHAYARQEYLVARDGVFRFGGVINLPRWARNEPVMLHELAHIVTPEREPWHGPEFAANYATLLFEVMGREAEAAFLEACSAHKVRVAGVA